MTLQLLADANQKHLSILFDMEKTIDSENRKNLWDMGLNAIALTLGLLFATGIAYAAFATASQVSQAPTIELNGTLNDAGVLTGTITQPYEPGVTILAVLQGSFLIFGLFLFAFFTCSEKVAEENAKDLEVAGKTVLLGLIALPISLFIESYVTAYLASPTLKASDTYLLYFTMTIFLTVSFTCFFSGSIRGLSAIIADITKTRN